MANEAPHEVYTVPDLRTWNMATAGVAPPVRLAVFGDPVGHSASPMMQNAALKHCGIEAQYGRIRVRPHELSTALRLLPAAGFIGVNLTIPHKAAAMFQMDEVDDHAKRIGAVNTVIIEDQKLTGFNTDGPGIVRAIRSEFSVDLRDLRVLILGAGGGAGRAIAMQCALEGCERLVLVNRTFEKAALLRRELEPSFAGARVIGPVDRLEAVPLDPEKLRFQLQNTDLVINATSLGMKRTDPEVLPESLLSPHLMVYDTVYTATRTKLLKAAEDVGARWANGLSMLLYQGALAFEIWFNREAPVDVMRRALITQ